jgi:putative transcriptional regulator
MTEITGYTMRVSRIIPSDVNGGDDMGFEEVQPEDVRAARAISGLTQIEAAPIVYTSVDNWQNWEQGRNSMARALYELFLLKTGQFTLREMVPGPNFTVMRLRLRTGHVIDMAVKQEVARQLAGITE